MPAEGRLGFLSKSARADAVHANTLVGPGEYSNRTDHNTRPNFAPFCTTTKREMIPPNNFTPSPGSYDIAHVYETAAAKKSGGSMFKSKSRRFIPPKAAEGPGPGTYALKPAIEVVKPMRRTRSQPVSIFDRVGEFHSQPSAPSIPTKFQSFGYEETDDGLLKPQEPLKPGFSGIKNDRVGPGDYDPKVVDSKHSRAPVLCFSKGASRTVGENPSSNPGPGYYNFRSDFESLGDEGNAESNFYLKLNQAHSRQLSSFASTSQRASVTKKIDPNEPGPGTYNVPRDSLKLKKTRPTSQCFDTTATRFQDPTPRSQRILTNPGSYNPLTSDFEKNRLNILRKKRMVARSGWAQNVSFQTTEERFFSAAKETSAPPPGTYKPRTGLADTLPHQNPRSGPFGSSLKRFYDPLSPKRDRGPSPKEAEEAFAAYSQHAEASRPEPVRRVAPSRAFASNEDRFEKQKDINHTPAPGTYNVTPKWGTNGIVKMKERTVQSISDRRITLPGPGDYNIDSSAQRQQRLKNPKSAMGGTGDRFPMRKADPSPGPADYDPIPVIGSFQTRTFNAMMADEEAMRGM